MVLSRLLYSLRTAWLNVAEMRRLNGFQARCLRVILRMRPAFESRVSNRDVLQAAGETELGKQLLLQQLLLYGQIVRALPSDPLRDLALCPGSCRPATDRYKRRVGRPCSEWAVKLRAAHYRLCHREALPEQSVYDARIWTKAARDYCRREVK